MARFRAIVPHRERSKVIESLLQKELDIREHKREQRLEDIARMVAEIAEIIIPKTDTPGAKDVGVPAFIDKMLGECYKKEDQDRFVKGATDFDADAKATYGDTFIGCDAD